MTRRLDAHPRALPGHVVIPEDRLRKALRTCAERFEPSTDAYARLAERISTERFPHRPWTGPSSAGFPAKATAVPVALAGGIALVVAGDEGDIFSAPPPFQRSADDPTADPGPPSTGPVFVELGLPATALAGPSMPPASEPAVEAWCSAARSR